MMKKLYAVLAIILVSCLGCSTLPANRSFTVAGDHGQLATVLHAPQGKPTYPLVLILHGFNASKDMYLLTELSNQLNARGIGTLLFDFNGHGQSEGDFLDMTIPNELEDARRIYAYASRLPQVSSISAVGHSQGAVVAAMLAGEKGADRIQTLVLMSPAPELKQDTASGNLFGVTYDPKNPPSYITLPTGLKVGRAYLTTTPLVPIYEVSSQYTGPVLVVHSADDQLVPYKYGVEFSQIYSQAHLETVHGFDHNFTQDTPAIDQKVADYLSSQLLP